MDIDEPKVSVIILTYNRTQLLPRAVNSVLKQTYTDFELIIVDDASVDDTEAVVKSFNDVRIIYIKHDRNKGASAARNTGIKIARGKFIAFLDDDDEWLLEKIEGQLGVFENSKNEKLGVVDCEAFYVYEFKQKAIALKHKFSHKRRGDVFFSILKGEFSTEGGSCYLIKKEVFNEVGYFDESTLLQNGKQDDYEMWIRISKVYHFDYVPQILLKRYFYSGTKSSTVSLEDKAKAIIYLHNKYEDAYKTSSRIYAGKLRYLGCQYCLLGDIKRGRQIFMKAFRVYPKNMVSIIYFFVSLFGLVFFRVIYNFKLKLKHFSNRRKFIFVKRSRLLEASKL